MHQKNAAVDIVASTVRALISVRVPSGKPSDRDKIERGHSAVLMRLSASADAKLVADLDDLTSLEVDLQHVLTGVDGAGRQMSGN